MGLALLLSALLALTVSLLLKYHGAIHRGQSDDFGIDGLTLCVTHRLFLDKELP